MRASMRTPIPTLTTTTLTITVIATITITITDMIMITTTRTSTSTSSGRSATTFLAARARKILFLDAPSGLAGDMIIAALVDLGVPEDVILDAVEALPLDGFHVHFGARTKSGIVGTAFDVHVDDEQPERTWGSIRKMLEKSKVPAAIKARSLATFRRLAESEAKVHRMPIEDVHFHEVGGVDAIVDIVGSAAALEHLFDGARGRVLVSPLPMGHGRIKARHGILPLPPPAVVECLRGLPTYDAGIAFELVTPTGAAIVGAHAEGAARWPSMKPERTGWGAGTADLADRPNLLRAVLGKRRRRRALRGAARRTSSSRPTSTTPRARSLHPASNRCSRKARSTRGRRRSR